MNIDLAEQKACSRCGEHLPLAEFRIRKKQTNARVSCCRGCRNLVDRLRYSSRAGQAARIDLEKSLRHLKSQREINVSRKLMLELIDRFGGAESLAQKICETTEVLMHEGRFAAAGTLLESVLAIFHACAVVGSD